MIIEDKEYIDALTPHTNGCKYIMIVKKNGDIYIDYGCDLRPNLQSGANRYIYDLIHGNGDKPVKLKISPELKSRLLAIKPCSGCGGTLFQHHTTAR